MSLRDTFQTYNPITLLYGCGFLVAGLWLIFEMVTHGVRTVAGVLLISTIVLWLITFGLAVIYKQLRMRRGAKPDSKQPTTQARS